jgi:hypothetical protein
MTTLEAIPTYPATDPPDATTIAPAAALRLHLRNRGVVGGFVDGGWWPRSLDLGIELPPLLAEMFSAGYDIHRITYNLARWDPAPRRVTVSGRQVKLGGYRTQNPALISLVDHSGWKRVDLVVIPPDTHPLIAERALSLASHDGDLHHAEQILELATPAASARISRTGCVDDLPGSGWETDGGRILAS